MSATNTQGSLTPRRRRSLRSLFVAAAAIAALAVLAPTMSASSQRSFHLAKVCVPDGSSCTVTESNYGPIRKGTTITYAGESFDALVATVHVAGGTASGDCDIASIFDDGSPGRCFFGGGTGPLKFFTGTLSVTFVDLFQDGSSLWFWDWTKDVGNAPSQ